MVENGNLVSLIIIRVYVNFIYFWNIKIYHQCIPIWMLSDMGMSIYNFNLMYIMYVYMWECRIRINCTNAFSPFSLSHVCALHTHTHTFCCLQCKFMEVPFNTELQRWLSAVYLQKHYTQGNVTNTCMFHVLTINILVLAYKYILCSNIY